MDSSANNGFATREQVAALGPLDVIDLSQAEFKDVTDARNGALTLPALGRLRATASRQADAREREARKVVADAAAAE